LKTAFRDKLGELNLEINQRRIAEASLKKSEEQFRLLFSIAPIGMVITGPDRSIRKVNKAFEQTLGYNLDELLKMTTIDLTYYEDKLKDEQIYKEFLDDNLDNKTFEKRFVTKDGNIIEVIVRTILYKDENKKPIIFIEQVIDITEQNKMQKDLRIAKEKAEESDRMKSAFLAQMSHEIRTPLNVILAASSIFEEEVKEYLDEDSREVVDSVKSAGKRLLRTIDLILNMSAIQTGKYEPTFEKIKLNEELKSMVHELKPVCFDKNILLNFATHIENAEIKADRYTVQQIFQNIISNSIKYTKQGKVDVVVFKTDKIFVEIKDTGIGMSKEYVEKLFNPFSQEDIGQKREFEGNGLGLALVKKYVDINNASIKVESEKGRGSTFTVIFNN
jgi:PAS domain S-box-containing protein